MATISVLDSAGSTVAIEKPLTPGRAAASASRPVVLSTEDAAFIDGIETAIGSTNTAIGSTNTKLDTLHSDLTATTPAGTNLIGRAVADASAATGGIASTARMFSASASVNATNAKASAGRVYQVSGKNVAAYDVYLVLYDSSSTPTVGTTTIRKKVIIPAGQAFVYDWPVGLYFGTGISYAFTKLVADADATALVAGDVVASNLDYN